MSPLLTVVLPGEGNVTQADQEVMIRCRSLTEASGHTLAAAVLAPDTEAHVDTLERYGAETVYTVDDPLLASSHPHPRLRTLQAVIEKVELQIVAFAA